MTIEILIKLLLMRMVASNLLGLFSNSIIRDDEALFSFSNSRTFDLFKEKKATSDPLIKPEETIRAIKSRTVTDNSGKAKMAKGKRTSRVKSEYSLSDSKTYELVNNRVRAVQLKRKIIFCISVIIKIVFSRVCIRTISR